MGLCYGIFLYREEIFKFNIANIELCVNLMVYKGVTIHSKPFL